MSSLTFAPNGDTVAALRQIAGYSRVGLAARCREVWAAERGGELRCSAKVIDRIETIPGYRPHEQVTWALARVLDVSVPELSGKVVAIEQPLDLSGRERDTAPAL